MSQSKLDNLISEAAAETRVHEAAYAAQAEALRTLRSQGTKPLRARPAWPVAAAAGVLAVVALIAMPRPSDAAALLAVLQTKPDGLIHTEVYTNGAKQSETYQEGLVARLIQANGIEQRFEPGKTTIRYPAGYATVESRTASAEFMAGPDLRRFLESDRHARVRKSQAGALTCYAVEGELTDGQGERRSYRARMWVDDRGRPVEQMCDMEGMGTSRIRWRYGGARMLLELTPVAKDRVYNLDLQRASLLTRLGKSRAVTPTVIRAYLDEEGRVGVLLSVPEGVSPRNERVVAAGAEVPTETLAFNADGQNTSYGLAVDAPVTYGNGRYVLTTLRPKKPLQTPFTLQFPFLEASANVKVQHPFARTGQIPEARLVVVPEVERTSNLIQLLSPMNAPFWITETRRGQAVKAAAIKP